MGVKNNNLFISVYAWQNDMQDYVVAGNLLFGKSDESGMTVTSFQYESSYVEDGFGSLDPANLNTKESNLVICKRPSGQLFGYFSNLLPGQFGNQLLADIDPIWPTLNEIQKLHVLTKAHGDFGPIHLNAQNDQAGEVIESIEMLDEVVQKIRSFQKGNTRAVLTPELEGALCSLGGSKPKVDFEVKSDGRVQRYVVKLNCSDCYNDAQVSSFLSENQKSARISICPRKPLALPCGEDVLVCTNYARKYVEPAQQRSGVIIRYNRVNFRTLLEDDPVLGVGEMPKIEHMIHVIDKYSDNPTSDKEELYRRTLFSVGTNHTSNGFDNMEMYDIGRGKWRLSPSYSNLPNPDRGTNFQVGIETGASCTSLVNYDERWLSMLGGQFGYAPKDSLVIAMPVVQTLDALTVRIEKSNLLETDKVTLKKILPSEQFSKLNQRIINTPAIMEQAKKRYGVQVVKTSPEPKKPSGGGPSMSS